MRALQHSTSASSTQPPTPPRTSLNGLKSLSGRLDSPVSTKAAAPQASSAQQLHTRRPSQAGEDETLREQLERSFCAVPPSQHSQGSSVSATSPPAAAPIRLPPRKQQRRPRMPAPEPVPVVHSSTYLSSAQRYNSSSSPAAAVDAEPASELSPLPSKSNSLSRHRATTPTDNALEWAMRRADQNLDQLEKNPLPLQKALYEISRGPVGEVTSSTVQAVAKLTLMAGQGVGRASAPVGKWALEEGLKAAGTLILAQKYAKNSEGNERKKA